MIQSGRYENNSFLRLTAVMGFAFDGYIGLSRPAKRPSFAAMMGESAGLPP